MARTARPASSSSSRIDSPSLKIAVAMALLRFRVPHRLSPSSSTTSSSPLLHWKRKAKERKREIQRLREELKLLQDGAQGEEAELPIASCRCHFFDGCRELTRRDGDSADGEHWIDEVLRRRFLRLIRWKERRRRVDGLIQRRSLMDFNAEDETQRLSVSIDFLVQLSDSIFLAKGEPESPSSTLCHQAIDFILDSLKNMVSSKKENELVEEIINGLIMRLMKRMCATPGTSDSGSADSSSNAQLYIQHLFRKLGDEEFIGQRIILSISQKISIVAESLLLLDPFDDAFPDMHDNMFIMIQLIEFLVSDHIKSWMCCEHFDKRLFEEWVRSILKARKDLEILENMNGLYVVYMERVVGKLAREVAPAAHQGKLDLEIFSKILF